MKKIPFEVLKSLFLHRGEFLSGSELGKKLNVSRVSISNAVSALRNDGFEIKSVSNLGHCLESIGDVLSEECLQVFFDIHHVTLPIFFVETIDSTNSLAKKLFSQGHKCGVVVSKEQSDGKGRRGRKFVSPSGGAYVSVFFQPKHLHPSHALQSVIKCGCATHDVLQKFQVESFLKWPNDVLCKNKKISGILCEMICQEDAVDCLVCGIGINVNTLAFGCFNDVATSMKIESGKSFCRAEVIAVLVEALLENLNTDFDFVEKFRKCTKMIGRDVQINQEDAVCFAKAVGLDKEGFLIVESDGILRKIVYGDVSVKGDFHD